MMRLYKMVSAWYAKNGNLKSMVNEMGLFTCILWKFLYIWKHQHKSHDEKNMAVHSGRSKNLERGVQPRMHEAHPKIFGLPHPLPVTMHS